MRALLISLALPLVATTAWADGHELTIGSSTRALRSSSADALTGDSLVGGSASLARAIDLRLPLDHLALWAQVGIDWGGASGTMFQTLATEVGGVALTGGARLRYTPLAHLAASAELGVGSERASVTLTDGAGHEASDHGWGGIARGALALDVLAVDTPGFVIGVRIELGYLAASGIELVPRRAQPDNTLQIPMTEASLGSLDLGGPYAHAGLLAQF
jgi:hypothetical protein